MNRIYTLLIILLFTGLNKIATGEEIPSFQIAYETDSLIQLVLAEISADSIKSYQQQLENMETRYTLAENRKEVAEWIMHKFESFGYSDVALEPFPYYPNTNSETFIDQYNVVCIKPGMREPQLVFGAHHDAVRVSPGADDNGSGTAGVLELARVMQKLQIKTNHTLKFITFAAEEIGLVGSNYSAHESIFQGDSIALMFNMDMISNAPADSVNEVGINFKENDSFLGELTTFAASNYTQMEPVYMGYPNNSDHYSYGKLGIPVLYFEEFYFSEVYHSANDLVSNTNPVYASRVLKTLASTALVFDALPEVPKSQHIQFGDGQRVLLTWDASEEDSVFNIYLAETANTFTFYAQTQNHSAEITNLTPGKPYQYFIQRIDKQNRTIKSANHSFTPDSIPGKTTITAVYGLNDKLQLVWQPIYDRDLVGYNVFEYSNGSSIKINSETIKESFYNINNISDSKYHYYQVAAIDSHGNQGLKSVAKGGKIGVNAYLSDSIEILVLLDIAGIPTQSESIIQYFEELLNGRNYQLHSLSGNEVLDQKLLNHSKIICWYTQKVSGNSAILSNKSVLEHYLQQGGKLFLSVSNANYAMTGFQRNLSSPVPEENPVNNIFKLAQLNYIPGSLFAGAEPLEPNYPELELDVTSVPATDITDGYLGGIQEILTNQEATPIYSFKSPNENDIIHGNMHGLPVGFESISQNYDLIFLSFPIGFMQAEQGKALMDYILDYRFINPTAIDQKHVFSNLANLKIWPNPSNGDFQLETQHAGIINIYTYLGQSIYEKSINQSGMYRIVLNPQLEQGVYLITFRTHEKLWTDKIIISN